MTLEFKKKLKWFAWFSAVLVGVVTVSVAYSTFLAERPQYGNAFDIVFAEDDVKKAWAVTRSLIIVCGGLFVIGTLILVGSCLGNSKKE